MDKYIRFESILILLLVVIALPLLFWNVGKQEVKNWDEATNANVVYDTLHTDHLLTLQYESQPFFEKPPLWYWLTMISVKIFGFNEFGIRGTTILSSISLLTLIYLFGRYHFNPTTGFFGVLVILATQQLFQVDYRDFFSTHSLRTADLDALQLAFMMGAFYCFSIRSTKIKYHFIAYTLTALAVMTKGPIGFLPVILHSVFSIYKDKNRSKLKSIWIYINKDKYLLLTLLIIILPWHFYEYMTYGQSFVDNYVKYHLLNRAFTTIEDHPGGPQYYVLLLFNPTVFVSGGLLLISIIYTLVKAKLKILTDYSYYLLIFGTLTPLILLTLVQTKLAWYLFYVYPFAALVLGYFISDIFIYKKFTINKYAYVLKVLILLLLGLNIYYNFEYISAIDKLDYCNLDEENIHQNRSRRFELNRVGEDKFLKYCYFRINN